METSDSILLSRIAKRIIVDDNGCHLWTGAVAIPGGYGFIKVQTVQTYVHRLVWRLANGPIAQGVYICHSCDVPRCCNIEHLFSGTPSENMKDMREKGRARYNMRDTGRRAKLTADEVEQLRHLRASGSTIAELVSRFGVKTRQIHHILSNESWPQ